MSTIGVAAAISVALFIGAPTAVATPSADAVKAINDRYVAFGGADSFLGAPTGKAVDVPGGAEQDYRGGVIYYSENTGAKVMYGQILEKYQSLGGPAGDLGFPVNDESDAGDGVGRFNDFAQPGGASIYWNPEAGAWVLRGRVLDAWRASGATTGPFGYPSADQTVADGVSAGRFVGPAGTEIRWSESAGLATVPPALAASIPGFGAVAPSVEGTVAVTTPSISVSAPSVDTSTNKTNWWPIVAGLAIAAGLAGLFGLLRRRRRVDVKVPTPRPPDLTRPQAPAPAPAPKYTPPAPLVKAPPPPPVVKAPPPPPVVKAPPPPPVVKAPPPPPVVKAPPPPVVKAAPPVVAPLVVNYDRDAENTSTGLEITYENNAIGANQQSVDDKSDLDDLGDQEHRRDR